MALVFGLCLMRSPGRDEPDLTAHGDLQGGKLYICTMSWRELYPCNCAVQRAAEARA